MLLNTLMDEDNADLIGDLKGSHRTTALGLLRSVKNDSHALAQVFRRSAKGRRK